MKIHVKYTSKCLVSQVFWNSLNCFLQHSPFYSIRFCYSLGMEYALLSPQNPHLLRSFVPTGGIIDSWLDYYNISFINGLNCWVHRWREQVRSSWRKLPFTRCIFSPASLYWVMFFHYILFSSGSEETEPKVHEL